MDVINPATGERVETYEAETVADVDDALAVASDAFDRWRNCPLREREQLLADAATELRTNDRSYAETITREMGKPISQALEEIEKCAWVCDHYAEHASTYLNPDGHPSPPGAVAKTAYEPLGPQLAVMPWNFPFWQVFRFAAPALTAGNTVLLKHASNVPGCSRAIENVFREAGYPDGTFQTLLITSDLVDEALEDDRVRGVTLTGSGPAGRAVASTAGRQLKRSVLELGGSDPFIVLDDADVEAAAETGASARMLNSGQSCIAAKRFLVHTNVYDEFLERFVDEIKSLTVGDPTDPETDVGPLATDAILEELDAQVTASLEAGARTVTGGEPLESNGAYYPPTVLVDVPDDCPAASEETFGPVAAVFEVDDESEAIRTANETEFGLGASIWTEDRRRGRRLSREIEAGCVFINQLVKSDPRVPFGGIKDSGYGRELSEAGIKEFVNRKTIWVE
ncbi:NAD-dependent succinate-semialdehyde dehydrogenase [Halopiger aswanensis]|uniref:Succinate-semialdehyde dehydrogenase/glutarate-semialdehyde dehydrogenase n=1 Tax=Halopiger aswanensis TaxID=148449 RepID=A0A419VZK5_9EURY|nr:NAD-dependent succinate-semialdehyde dehydrogenase [Halopiger aswanensis]RKD88656.1 succinate-semialdehyde dehydrogenase/glutarate-semialdehyde dehydrogenase [Halopiger aswanensis]